MSGGFNNDFISQPIRDLPARDESEVDHDAAESATEPNAFDRPPLTHIGSSPGRAPATLFSIKRL